MINLKFAIALLACVAAAAAQGRLREAQCEVQIEVRAKAKCGLHRPQFTAGVCSTTGGQGEKCVTWGGEAGVQVPKLGDVPYACGYVTTRSPKKIMPCLVNYLGSAKLQGYMWTKFGSMEMLFREVHFAYRVSGSNGQQNNLSPAPYCSSSFSGQSKVMRYDLNFAKQQIWQVVVRTTDKVTCS